MNLLEFSSVEKTFGRARAVAGVSIGIEPSTVVGLVGESGCGKTTLGRIALGLIQPSAGAVFFRGKNIAEMNRTETLSFRRQAQMIFQDPYASLNPRKTIRQTLSEGLIIHRLCASTEREARVTSLLEKVGLEANCLDRYPHEFSGGQRQRIGIARSLSTEPSFIVADEPVSALDVSVQAQIVHLLMKLRSEMNLTFLFISHDLRVIEYVSNALIVMYLGKVMEYLPAKNLASRAQHPYTKSLLDAIPTTNPNQQRTRILLSGDIPSPHHPPAGCVFHTRCPIAEDRCRTETPIMKRMSDNHSIACHLT